MDTRGECKFSDGLILYYVYQGSMDLCYSNLKSENDFNWNTERKECTCGEPNEKVKLIDNYGYYSERDGKACRKCLCITEGLDPYSIYKEGV